MATGDIKGVKENAQGGYDETLLNSEFLPLALTVPSVNGSASGNVTSGFLCGYSNSAVGDLVYLDSSSTWQKAGKTVAAASAGLLGIALEVKSSGQVLKVALPGSIVYTTAFPSLTVGAPVYMGDAGAVVVAQPSTSSHNIRVIGWGVGTWKLYFFPSPDYITHT